MRRGLKQRFIFMRRSYIDQYQNRCIGYLVFDCQIDPNHPSNHPNVGETFGRRFKLACHILLILMIVDFCKYAYLCKNKHLFFKTFKWRQWFVWQYNANKQDESVVQDTSNENEQYVVINADILRIIAVESRMVVANDLLPPPPNYSW